MKQRRSDCLACGLPCLGRSCPHHLVDRILCDFCLEYEHEETDAKYRLDGIDLCESCLYDAVIDYVKEMSISEIKEKLGLNIERILE